MTTILTYNILVGGTRRVEQLFKIISSVNPDIVGLVEATNPYVVEELAQRLGMEYRMTSYPKHTQDWQLALLSRLPIVRTHTHVRPGILSKPLLEVCVEEADGWELTVFVTHLSAAFSHGRGGDSIRRAEVCEILRIMATKRGTPHVLIGDFNTIAPRDRLQASRLLRYLLAMDRRYKQNPHEHIGHPYLDFVVPPALRFLEPILSIIPRSMLLSALFDQAGSLYAPRGSIRLVLKAGYIDCFRRLNPRVPGFTCPASAPAGRIDFIFASPELAERLSASRVVAEGNGLRGGEASDHLPVLAEFGPVVGQKFIAPPMEFEGQSELASTSNKEDEDVQGVGID